MNIKKKYLFLHCPIHFQCEIPKDPKRWYIFYTPLDQPNQVQVCVFEIIYVMPLRWREHI